MTENDKISVHQKTFDIAWGDMDALGHVNNGKYFDYFQEARIEWLSKMNFSMREKTGPVVIHVACTFLKPLVYPARVNLLTSLHDLGHTSMIMDHDLYLGETLVAQGVSKVVWIDYTQNKAVPLPQAIRDLFGS